jgi:hypothetical protein
MTDFFLLAINGPEIASSWLSTAQSGMAWLATMMHVSFVLITSLIGGVIVEKLWY